MPLLLLAALGLGSAYGVKKYWDTKHPKFFFWQDRGITEEEKGGYSIALFQTDNLDDLKTMMQYAFNKGHLQVAELLAEKILTLQSANDPNVAVLVAKYPSAITILQLPDSPLDKMGPG